MSFVADLIRITAVDDTDEDDNETKPTKTLTLTSSPTTPTTPTSLRLTTTPTTLTTTTTMSATLTRVTMILIRLLIQGSHHSKKQFLSFFISHRGKKNFWKVLVLNPCYLAPQATTLTTKPWLCRQQ